MKTIESSKYILLAHKGRGQHGIHNLKTLENFNYLVKKKKKKSNRKEVYIQDIKVNILKMKVK